MTSLVLLAAIESGAAAGNHSGLSEEAPMSTDQIQHERRAAQRFDFHLPVSIRLAGGDIEGNGFTQNLSARGAFVYTDFSLLEGDAVELTLMMPSEITLAETMRIRCRGRVLRISDQGAGSRRGVAVQVEGYEFLPEAVIERTSGLQEPPREEEAEMAPHTFQMRGAHL
jgi:hypothetical protein